MRIFFLGLLYGWYAGYTIDIFREKMKNGKAVGQEWIPAEAWNDGSENSLCHFLSTLANGEDSVGRNRKLCTWFL